MIETFAELEALQPAAVVMPSDSVTLPEAPAVNVTLCAFVALVIVPFAIVQAYVAIPAGPLAVFPVELALTTAGAVIVALAELTVSVAVLVFAEPQLFVKTARYCFALSADVGVNVNVADVAPPMFVKLTPSVETCHCTEPDDAAAVNVTALPHDV